MDIKQSKLISLSEIDSLTINDIWELYNKYINPGTKDLYSAFSFGNDVFIKAEGMYIFTKDGRKILDFTGGKGVLNHGHNHPDIIAARLKFQNENKMEVHKLVFSPYTAVLSHNIAELLPSDLNKCFFPNSGGEAVEGAIKLAYRASKGKRDYILHSDRGYHGKLIASGSISANDSEDNVFPVLLNRMQFEYGNIESVIKLINKLKKKDKSNIYAIIIEPFCANTYESCSKDFLFELRKLCNDNNIALIFDEVYTGWGKTGHLFYFMKYSGLFPDILTMSKSIGGGKSSISCFVTRDKLFFKAYGNVKQSLMHSSTYSGFGEEAATAIEAIRIVVEDKYPLRSQHINKKLIDSLNDLKNKFPHNIEDIKGEGSLIGIKFCLSENYEKLFKLIPLEIVNNKIGFFEKIIIASIIDNLYKNHNILVAADERNYHNPESNKKVYVVFLGVQPSCIVEDIEIDYFIKSLDLTLKSGLHKLVKNFILKNLKKVFK